ncbi:MAG: TMEM165/GDT1 family protein [Pseudomonadales bacterium]|nr:TMEM165/GDT1 family protein [Pseudomonadales bacterium]
MLSSTLSSLLLVALAELGDKSQLVCMTLAARHRPGPVLLGACLAFAGLDALAVVFGAGIAALVPERVLAGVVGLLFLAFGVAAFRDPEPDEVVDEAPGTGRSVLLSTTLLVFLAEFGDKTQLAVAALAAELEPLAVWIGATAGLCAVSALGVLAGRRLLRRLPVSLLHRAAGALFLALGLVTLTQAIP